MKLFLMTAIIATTLAIGGCAQKQESTVPESIMTNDGNVNILWQTPNDYSDIEATIGLQSTFEQYLFTQLTDELGKLANKHLANDQQLDLTVTNVDLAGDVQPTFGATTNDIRVISDLYPPKISFDYALTQNGKIIKSGSEKLNNMGFLFGIQPITNDAFPYERDLLLDWFKKTIMPVL
ncbi:DUF3016 domain-containing protein [Shewanella schlegeliana]|uniref:DUF3016 domain-containing protein n=1 Tax=Shewanella schlegeliana TaxID=190308 RepID=A0ABS1SWM2_9GAMM|nr:DUF3016 domain-containing protein [Shewanella schlegeliana]MBL4912425.1 DUF3016 domain-containing protein [Shewanella schlegeliana]MCL1108105.1 DUF3016 domain-containing protein [Shewanella schlegeliana]GIU21804.1 hypothetical protein TUM4433_01630 [Shewanella schlegeliana]